MSVACDMQDRNDLQGQCTIWCPANLNAKSSDSINRRLCGLLSGWHSCLSPGTSPSAVQTCTYQADECATRTALQCSRLQPGRCDTISTRASCWLSSSSAVQCRQNTLVLTLSYRIKEMGLCPCFLYNRVQNAHLQAAMRRLQCMQDTSSLDCWLTTCPNTSSRGAFAFFPGWYCTSR